MPFFFDKKDWIPVPKDCEIGQRLYLEVQLTLKRYSSFNSEFVIEESVTNRYGSGQRL
jgi:hypothetical protein